MKPVVFAVLPAISLVLASQNSTETTQEDRCRIQAWVRAEDLSPDHVSSGELRIKVGQPQCADQIASVALRLQLDEFSDVKYLKQGAILPQRYYNETTHDGNHNWFFNVAGGDDAYDHAMGDPTLWTVKGEERRAWTTEAMLLENNTSKSPLPVSLSLM